MGKKKANAASVVMETMQSYDDWVATFHCNPSTLERLGLRLAGEAGEVAQDIGKGRNYKSIALELGDTLYMLVRLANQMNYTLGDIAEMNRKKLEKRHGKKS